MAGQSAPPKEITFEEFVERYTGRRYEYVGGRAVPMGPEAVGPEGEVEVAPTKFGHGKITGRIHSLLGAYVMQHNLGEVLSAETGFLMRNDPPEMRAADIAFIPRERADARSPLPAPAAATTRAPSGRHSAPGLAGRAGRP